MLLEKKQAYLLCLFSIALLGCNAIFGKTIMLSPEHLVLGRCLIAGSVIGVFLKLKKEKIRAKSKKNFFQFCGLALLMGIHWISMFKALQVSSVAISLIAIFTFPMMTTLLEPIILKKKFKVRYLFSALLVLIGIGLLDPSLDLNDNTSQGILWGLISALSFALRNIYTRKSIQKISASKLMFYQCILVSFCLLPTLATWPKKVALNDWIQLIIFGVIFTAFAHILYSKSLSRLSASFVGILSCIQPLYGSILAYFILNESPQSKTIYGGSLILSVVVFHSIRLYVKQKSLQ